MSVMKQITRDRILAIFHEQSGYARTKDVKDHGIHHIHLKELQEDGTIIKIKNGLYCLADHSDYSRYSSLKEAQLFIPNGVICLGTALSYYGLTTWDPPEIHIAIPKSRNVELPDYPPIRIYYFSGIFYTKGIVNETFDSGDTIKIYDREKTICDIIRYRNQIGIDIMKEALREYVNGNDRDLNTLNSYAKDLKIGSILVRYLEVLL